MRTDLLLGIEHREQFSDALFRMIFGRKPSYKRDKTFLVRYLNTIGKTREELLELHLKSGITKEQLAAIYETGIAPTWDDFKRYPSRLLRQWLDIASEPSSANAVDQRLAPKILEDSVGEAATTLYLELSNSVIRICHLLETGAKGARYSDVGTLFLYILARIAELLRGIRVLMNNDESAAILGLIRGLYECFTRLLFANRKPELAWALILPAMVDGKKFEYCRNRVGRVERRKVRELETGNEFRIDYSLAEIFRLCEADRDAAVHPEFYLALSAEVHPTAELLFEFVQKQGFLLHRTPDTLFTIHMAGYVLFLIWREICVFPLLSKRDSRDARFALDEIREAMLVIIERLRPVVLKSVADPFKDLFLGIAASVADPYDDRYWRNMANA